MMATVEWKHTVELGSNGKLHLSELGGAPCRLIFLVTLSHQVRVICEEGTSTEKNTPPVCPVGKSVGSFLD